MTSAVFEPTEVEQRAIQDLRERILRFLDKNPQQKATLGQAFGLSERGVDSLLARKDWTLSAALRIADLLSVEFDMKVT